MDTDYKRYLEELYSASPYSQLVGLWEPSSPALDAHRIVYGSEGFGKTSTIPNLLISYENSKEHVFEWMLSCLDIVGIQEECFLWMRAGPWGQIKITSRAEWLASVWGMPFPQTNDIVTSLLAMNADRSQTIFFFEGGHYLEVCIGRL